MIRIRAVALRERDCFWYWSLPSRNANVRIGPRAARAQASMLIAILSDIHANREALEACLAHLEPHSVGRYGFLHDIVGYGADPGFVIDLVRDFVALVASALIGNHDIGAIGNPERMNDGPMLAIEWM